MSMNKPLFSFGLISDIQYADIEPASNFSGTEHREYRSSVHDAAAVVKAWGNLESPLTFIGQLGDLIDGQNAGAYGQGLTLDRPQSEQALERVLKIWDQYSSTVYHAIGNHELYNFTWAELRLKLNTQRVQCTHQVATQEFYYSFTPYPGWRVIILNSYEDNVIKPKSEQSRLYTERLLKENNHNFGAKAPFNFFEGVPIEKQRYVPFNGGFGEKQLAWLKVELATMKERGEVGVIASHLPCFAPAASFKNIAFDADSLHTLIGSYAEQVWAYFAGHRHGGGYGQDHHGIHHVTIQSPLTHGICATTVEVYDDLLKVCGIGAHRSYHLTRD